MLEGILNADATVGFSHLIDGILIEFSYLIILKLRSACQDMSEEILFHRNFEQYS